MLHKKRTLILIFFLFLISSACESRETEKLPTTGATPVPTKEIQPTATEASTPIDEGSQLQEEYAAQSTVTVIAWLGHIASLPESKIRGYKPGRFSFNVKGGRCEACQGQGQLRIEMQFMPDVYVPCDVCHGARFNRETLQVRFKDYNIADVLDMTVDHALEVFSAFPKMVNRLQTLQDVGLGYIRIGQPAPTLSGGEAQRVKLSRELSKRSTGSTMYVLDEPSVGLHAADVHKLIEVLHRLVDAGNSVVIIEHNLDIIKVSDHIIDLGPEGGDRGGEIVATGTPEEVCSVRKSYTGQFLSQFCN